LHVVVRPDFKGDFLIAQIYTNRERIYKTSRYVIKIGSSGSMIKQSDNVLVYPISTLSFEM
ncbi:MAG: hypothetical protein ABS921_12075, partial [Psychrobacter alimentarius]